MEARRAEVRVTPQPRPVRRVECGDAPSHAHRSPRRCCCAALAASAPASAKIIEVGHGLGRRAGVPGHARAWPSRARPATRSRSLDERARSSCPRTARSSPGRSTSASPPTEQIAFFDEELRRAGSARPDRSCAAARRLFHARGRPEPDRRSSRRTSAQTVQFPLGRALNVKKGYVIALTVPTWAPALTPLLTDHVLLARVAAQGQVRRHRDPDRPDDAGQRRAVPLPLQGAADLQRDADHPPEAADDAEGR